MTYIQKKATKKNSYYFFIDHSIPAESVTFKDLPYKEAFLGGISFLGWYVVTVNDGMTVRDEHKIRIFFYPKDICCHLLSQGHRSNKMLSRKPLILHYN